VGTLTTWLWKLTWILRKVVVRPDITRTQYASTKCRSCSESSGWASNARNV
jgi:hypothetical protein